MPSHPNPVFSYKVQRGDQEKFFKNRQKSSPRLNGPKAHWHKWHYPLKSMYLKFKDWRTFWFKQRVQKFPNGQVMAIFARSPKTRIFSEKVQRGEQGKFYKNWPKSSHRLKGLKALWCKWHFPPISMLLKCKDYKRFWCKRRLQKLPE